MSTSPRHIFTPESQVSSEDMSPLDRSSGMSEPPSGQVLPALAAIMEDAPHNSIKETFKDMIPLPGPQHFNLAHGERTPGYETSMESESSFDGMTPTPSERAELLEQQSSVQRRRRELELKQLALDKMQLDEEEDKIQKKLTASSSHSQQSVRSRESRRRDYAQGSRTTASSGANQPCLKQLLAPPPSLVQPESGLQTSLNLERSHDVNIDVNKGVPGTSQQNKQQPPSGDSFPGSESDPLAKDLEQLIDTEQRIEEAKREAETKLEAVESAARVGVAQLVGQIETAHNVNNALSSQNNVLQTALQQQQIVADARIAGVFDEAQIALRGKDELLVNLRQEAEGEIVNRDQRAYDITEEAKLVIANKDFEISRLTNATALALGEKDRLLNEKTSLLLQQTKEHQDVIVASQKEHRDQIECALNETHERHASHLVGFQEALEKERHNATTANQAAREAQLRNQHLHDELVRLKQHCVEQATQLQSTQEECVQKEEEKGQISSHLSSQVKSFLTQQREQIENALSKQHAEILNTEHKKQEVVIKTLEDTLYQERLDMSRCSNEQATKLREQNARMAEMEQKMRHFMTENRNLTQIINTGIPVPATPVPRSILHGSPATAEANNISLSFESMPPGIITAAPTQTHPAKTTTGTSATGGANNGQSDGPTDGEWTIPPDNNKTPGSDPPGKDPPGSGDGNGNGQGNNGGGGRKSDKDKDRKKKRGNGNGPDDPGDSSEGDNEEEEGNTTGRQPRSYHREKSGRIIKASEPSAIKLKAMPTMAQYESWRTMTRETIVTAGQGSRECWDWVCECEVREADYDALSDPGIYVSLDMKIKLAVLDIATGIFQRVLSLKSSEAFRKGRMLAGRQSLYLLHQRYKLDEDLRGLYDITHLQAIVWQGDEVPQIQAFMQSWTECSSAQESNIEQRQIEKMLVKQMRKSKLFEADVRDYDKGKPGSVERTEQYLWQAMTEYCDRKLRDKNATTLVAAWNGAKGTPAVPAVNGDGNPPVCRFWLKGTCTKGKDCAFTHPRGQAAAKAKAKAKSRAAAPAVTGGGGGGKGRGGDPTALAAPAGAGKPCFEFNRGNCKGKLVNGLCPHGYVRRALTKDEEKMRDKFASRSGGDTSGTGNERAVTQPKMLDANGKECCRKHMKSECTKTAEECKYSHEPPVTPAAPAPSKGKGKGDGKKRRGKGGKR